MSFGEKHYYLAWEVEQLSFGVLLRAFTSNIIIIIAITKRKLKKSWLDLMSTVYSALIVLFYIGKLYQNITKNKIL